MSFAPLDSGFIFSTTFRLGPVPAAVWGAILSTKDEFGITNINPETLASIWNMEETEIQKVWDVLSSPDPKSKNKEFEGRRIIPTEDGRWLVTGHDKYRGMYQKEVRREQVASAVRRFREKEKAKIIKAGGYIACECGEPATKTEPDGSRWCDACEPRQPGEEG